MTHPLKRKAAQAATITIDVGLDEQGKPQEPIVLTFRALTRRRWNDLVDEHPPTEAQIRTNRELQLKRGTPLGRMADVPWNKDTFPAALMAECSLEPAITAEEAAEVWDPENPDWNDAELEQLFNALVIINQGTAHVRLGKELAEMLASGRN